ncbi:MAG: tetratricopeptide repeat protein [Deltaproteobacteria bacterium]|nr:tetratricopeptide repeat protein [Deltaproteobacteria bacterium]
MALGPRAALLGLALLGGCATLPGCGAAGGEHGPVGRIFSGQRVMGRSISEKAYYHYLRADLFSLNGDADAAVKELRFALAFDPEGVELHRRLAEELIRLLRYDEAAEAVERALRLDSRDAESWLLKGRLRARAGDAEGALQAFRAAGRAEPDTQDAYLALADHQLGVGDPTGAVATLQRLVSRLQTSAEAHARLGRALSPQDPAAAIVHLRRAIQLEPSRVDVQVELAELLALQGQGEEAIGTMREAFERAGDRVAVAERLIRLQLDRGDRRGAAAVVELLDEGGQDPRQQLVLATLYRALKDLPRARALAAAALAQKPDLHAGRLLLGAILDEARQPEAALAEFAKIPSAAEESVEARRRAAEVLRVQGQLPAAIALLEQAVAARPDNDELIDPLAQLLARAGQLDRAQALLGAALKKRPTSETLQYAVAVAYDLGGQWQKAVAEMRALLRRSPRHAAALNFVGYTLAEHGAELEQAQRLVVASLALRPLDGYVLDSLGWVYFRLGRLDQARDTLEKANRLAPGEPEILKHLGEVALRQRDPGRAAGLLHRALERNPDPKLRREIEDLLRAAATPPARP